MRIEKDYEELLELLNKHKVKYCIVGAYALAYHKKARYTKDLDIFIEPKPENSENIIAALNGFGFSSLNLKEEDFMKENTVIQLGYEPVRVDLITSLTGITFEEAWNNKKVGKYGRQDVYFIGIEELIKNKERTGRKQDKLDLDLLT